MAVNDKIRVPDTSLRFEEDGSVTIPGRGVVRSLDNEKLKSAQKPFVAEMTDVSGAGDSPRQWAVTSINPA